MSEEIEHNNRPGHVRASPTRRVITTSDCMSRDEKKRTSGETCRNRVRAHIGYAGFLVIGNCGPEYVG
jgi:hypothetical protein